jgi:ATP-dependent 26S proteasome regulatory subunit
MSNNQKFEIHGLDVTQAAGMTFVGALDAQIQELKDNLERLHMLRAAVARTFGVDRPDGGSFVEKLTAGANRTQFEGEKKAGAV